MYRYNYKIDENCRSRQADWNSLSASLAAATRKKDGSLRDRDIDDSVVPAAEIIDTEYLCTVLVVLTSSQQKPFLANYETFAPFVVPRSAKELFVDGDESLWRVVLFRRAADDFRHACREHRYIIREYIGESNCRVCFANNN